MKKRLLPSPFRSAHVDPQLRDEMLDGESVGLCSKGLWLVHERAVPPIDAGRVRVLSERGDQVREPHMPFLDVPGTSHQGDDEVTGVAAHALGRFGPPPGGFAGAFEVGPGDGNRHQSDDRLVAAKGK